jgi:hypothetical protein
MISRGSRLGEDEKRERSIPLTSADLHQNAGNTRHRLAHLDIQPATSCSPTAQHVHQIRKLGLLPLVDLLHHPPLLYKLVYLNLLGREIGEHLPVYRKDR